VFSLQAGQGVVSKLALGTVRECIYFAIWWFYFKMSKRVINTYGAEAERTKLE
jgi:hypothetical protein